tara:strand:+ start:300 stop:509 length:210 start_codon:yes stop_codon:yes gene_type:complete
MPYFEGFEKDRVFKFLFKLQVSDNAPNMFNCGIYVQKRFGLTHKETEPIVLEWMKDYEQIYDRMEIDKE